MDLNELAIFARVIQLGSFSAAARSFGSPVSTISRKVTSLEQRLGVQLLHRTTRKLGVTDAGAAYFRVCEQMLTQVAEAEADLGAQIGHVRGDLKVSLPIAFGRFAFTRMLGDFCERYPDVRISAVLSNAYVDLVEGGFDLAVRTGRLQDSALRCRLLAECPFVIAASPTCIERHGRPSTPDDFARIPCLVLSEEIGSAKWTFYGEEQPFAVRVKVAMASNDMGILREAALWGLGFVLVPGFLLADDLRRGALISLDGDWRLDRGQVHAVYPGKRKASGKVRALVDFLAERLTDDPYWCAPSPNAVDNSTPEK